MKRAKMLFAPLVLTALVIVAASPAVANTEYTYTGNQFTFLLGTTCPPECSLSGYFTLASPLGDNVNGASFTPTTFSFTDGLMTITQANATGFHFDGVSTNSSGVIVGWNMDFTTAAYKMFTGTNPPGCAGCSVIDVTFNNAITIEGAVPNNPGKWTTTTTSVVPEPTSFVLLMTGLAGVFTRRRLIRRGAE
jgi:hypothetical protein